MLHEIVELLELGFDQVLIRGFAPQNFAGSVDEIDPGENIRLIKKVMQRGPGGNLLAFSSLLQRLKAVNERGQRRNSLQPVHASSEQSREFLRYRPSGVHSIVKQHCLLGAHVITAEDDITRKQCGGA